MYNIYLRCAAMERVKPTTADSAVERDSNPCNEVILKLISSLPSCAHFDNCVEKIDIVLPTVGGKASPNKAGRYKDDLRKFDEKEWILVYDPSSTG